MVSLLIQNGHREEAIGKYAYDKFFLFAASAGRLAASSRIATVVDLSKAITGSLADAKILTEHMKQLREVVDNGS